MEKRNRVLIVDFGGQNARPAERQIRDLGVYCEITPWNKAAKKIEEFMPSALVFVGGASAVVTAQAAEAGGELLKDGLPVLGIEYGMLLIAQLFGGECDAGQAGEYAKAEAKPDAASPLFNGVPQSTLCWMQNGFSVKAAPQGFVCTASADGCGVAAMECADRKIYGVQFHPQSSNTDSGTKIIENFLFGICGLEHDPGMTDYSEKTIADLRAQIGDSKVLLALSGGVDSSVCAAMLSKAVGKQLICVFVDHGLMRKSEGNEVEQAMKVFDSTFIRVDAEDRFLSKLKGVSDPEKKRKIVGEEFIRVFEEEVKRLRENFGDIDYLAQGTIYTDVTESGLDGHAAIKAHHNVGGLPQDMDFKGLVEPLRPLYKHEVRKLGRSLGLPRSITERQPFPGPGLGVRVLGEVTKEKLDILRTADAIFREELDSAGVEAGEYFAIHTGLRSVGVRDGARVFGHLIALRAVKTIDLVTADWVRVPFDVLERVSARITDGCPDVNRVVYDITSKPPATIEWE